MGVNRTRPLVVMSREEHYAKNLRERFDRGFANFGLEHGLGWLGIVHTLHNRLAHLDPDYRVYQIKEKFGMLRYYCSAGGGSALDEEADAIRSLVSEAERQSSITCEVCGEPGTLTDTGWMKVRCGDCKAKEDEAANTDQA